MKKLIMIALILSLLICSGCGDTQIQNVSVTSDQTLEENLDLPQVNEERIQLKGPYKVVKVVDGDTITIDLNGIEEKIRLIGIDTPESVHPDEDRNVEYGKIASEFTKKQLLEQEVYLEYDVQERDKYGRILAYAYIDDRMFNKTLLEEGHAKVATYPPNVKYVEEFTVLQEQAREKEKGIWAYENLNSPNQTNTTNPSNTDSNEISYIGNSNSLKLHKNTCSSVDKISSSNLVYFKTRSEAIDKEYVPCKICNP